MFWWCLSYWTVSSTRHNFAKRQTGDCSCLCGKKTIMLWRNCHSDISYLRKQERRRALQIEHFFLSVNNIDLANNKCVAPVGIILQPFIEKGFPNPNFVTGGRCRESFRVKGFFSFLLFWGQAFFFYIPNTGGGGITDKVQSIVWVKLMVNITWLCLKVTVKITVAVGAAKRMTPLVVWYSEEDESNCRKKELRAECSL